MLFMSVVTNIFTKMFLNVSVSGNTKIVSPWVRHIARMGEKVLNTKFWWGKSLAEYAFGRRRE